jgi:hypothetical protein
MPDMSLPCRAYSPVVSTAVPVSASTSRTWRCASCSKSPMPSAGVRRGSSCHAPARPASQADAPGRTAWLAVRGPAAGSSIDDQRSSSRRNTSRSADRRRPRRRGGTGRVAGAVLPGHPGCRRRARSDRRTPPASPGSGSADQRRPGRPPGVQLSHLQACRAGGSGRGSGFSSPDFPSLRQLICGGRRQEMRHHHRPGHVACRVHRGTWTRRLASSASALGVICPFPGALEHGQDSAGGTWGQLRLSRTEGHLDQLALSCLCSARSLQALAGRHVAGHARRLAGAAVDSSGAVLAGPGPASPHLTCRTEWSVDRRRCTTGQDGPASAASIRGMQGHRVSDLGGE